MLGTTIALSALPANAQDAPTVQQVASVSTAPNQVDAQTRANFSRTWQEAQDHSINNPVITYLVIGQTDRFSNDQLRGGFASMFTDDKNPHAVEFANLKSFGVAKDLDGAKFEFYVDGVLLGPYDFLEAVEEVPRISKMYLENKPVHEKRLAEEQRATPPAKTVTTAALTTAYE